MSFYSSLDSRSLDPESPTIFEIISSNELSELLTPSVKYIFVHFTHKFPKYLLKIYTYFDEINLFSRLILEYNFLKKWNSTFTEKFYGIKRSSNIGINFKNSTELKHLKKKLNHKQIWGSLFFLLGVPYLKEKLDVIFEKWNADYLINKNNYSLNSKDSKVVGKFVFLKLYPILNCLITILQIFLKIGFISNKSVFPTISSYFLNFKYLRLSKFDLMENPKDKKHITRIRPLSLGESINQSLLTKILKPFKISFINIFDKSFPILMFSLKFFEWWEQNDFVRSIINNKNNFLKNFIDQYKFFPSPNTVKVDEKVSNEQYYNHEYENCAICSKKIQNPCVIETGYTFCYPCIMNYLTEPKDFEKAGRCPITGTKLLGCEYDEIDKKWNVNGVIKLVN